MAVYKRGYQKYDGPRTSHAERMLVIPRFAWERLLSQKAVTVLMVVALFWPLLCTLFVYLANHSELWSGFGAGFKRILAVNGKFFVVFMNVQSVFALILAAVAGPGLIAPDLVNNALPLYFSRPLNVRDYILSRMLVLAGILGLVTIIPGLLLLSIQTGMAGVDWLWNNGRLFWGVLAGFTLWILILSLVAMTSSAYIKWRVVAGGGVLAFFFFTGGAAEMINAVFRVDWASMFNPSWAIEAVWMELLGVEIPPDRPGFFECALSLSGLCAGLTWMLTRKLRPVEVVK
ncbi:MAG: hypothetical protein FJW30_05835 [Acidobacteria bacterium]|nr:hypothetical protein [Acidobacteriota bacterium]